MKSASRPSSVEQYLPIPLKHENKTPASVSFSIQFKTEEIQEPAEKAKTHLVIAKFLTGYIISDSNKDSLLYVRQK